MIELIKFGFRYIRKSLYICYLFLCGAMSLVGTVTPLLMGGVINCLTDQKSMDITGKMIGIFCLFGIFEIIVGVLQNYISVKLEADSGYKANKHFLKKLYHTSYLNVGTEDPAMLNQKLSTDLNSVVSFSIAFFRDVINNVIFVVCIALILVFQSPELCVVLFVLAFCYALVYLRTRKKMYDVSFQVKEAQTSFFGHLYGMVYFMKSIRNNGFESRSFQKLDKEYTGYYKCLQKQVNVNTIFNSVIDMISLLAQTFLFFLGGKMVLEGQLSIGLLVALLNYFSILLRSTDYFLNLGQNYQNMRSSYQRLIPYDVMEQIVEGKEIFHEIKEVELKDVRFAYPGQKPLFCMNQKLERGKIYWVKGKNGIGKSSLMNLILGLFGNDYSGEIQINKSPLKQVDLSRFIQEKTAIVEQEPYLLSDSLRSNILCKTLGEEKEEIDRLFTLFGMDDFMKKQEKGLDTVYNSMNSAMSGGEKQKFAIIRMFLSSADVWFLDEPTSALDLMSTKHFYEELKRQKEKHIIIMISHEIPQEYDEVIEMRQEI